MIQLENVKKVFNQGKPNEFWAIRGISLTLEKNRVSVFQGASGSGKTTLLTLIGALARPTSGRVSLEQKIISSYPERFLTRIRQGTFGFVFQQFNLIKGLSVLENVMLPAYPLGLDHSLLKQKAVGIIQSLHLSAKKDAKVEWLSSGEAQRTAIARALINDPAILIADEPTANLDTKLSGELLTIISDLKAQGKTILLSSHDPRIIESTVVDQVYKLKDGTLEGSS